MIRELSETELDAVEGAHGIFEYMRTKLGDRMKAEAEDRSAPLIHVFDLAARSAKRDLAAHRHALATRSTKTKRR